MKPFCPQCAERWNCCQCLSWPAQYICFARPQVFRLLQTGFSPEAAAAYSDEKLNQPKSQAAPFESASCIKAEIEARLERCGEAGEALADEAPKIESLKQLSRPATRALNYCSGWRRRAMSYAKWRWQQDERGSS
jgi:hypothetical protein